MTAQTTGRFVWHELHTGDRAKAQTFYAALTGWEVKEFPMGPGEPYGLCLLGGKDHAGITKSMAPAGVPPHWLPYMAVEDVDAAAARVKELGGKVLSPPTDIPNVGRFAVCMDPQGGAFALHKHLKPYPEEPQVPPVSSFCWDELATTDPEAATKFYTALFGYSVQEVPMGPMGTYRILKRGDRQTAGITKIPPHVPQHSNWLTYVAVTDVDAATRKARELGAEVELEPQDIPGIGRFSIITDPTGAPIALFKGTI
jgi:predicted enzyme related to lactoylglutathione lyase